MALALWPNASFGAEAVAPQHAVERSSIDAEDRRRARDVAVGLGDHVREIAALHLFECRRAPVQRRLEARAQLGREVVRRQHLTARERDGALDAVLELADVAGPP